MISVGIDPGLTGGIAVWNPTRERLRVWPIPTIETGKGRKVRDRLDELAMFRLAGLIASMGPTVTALEAVGGMPRQSAHRAFVFGDLTGAIRMSFVAHGVQMHRPAPAVWKAAYGLKGGKDNKQLSLDKATALFPQFAHYFRRKSDDGLAEAALLAHYAATKLADPPWRA